MSIFRKFCDQSCSLGEILKFNMNKTYKEQTWIVLSDQRFKKNITQVRNR